MSVLETSLPLARLVGVTEYPGERLDLTHANIMQALRFAQESGVIPPLPEDWWARDGGTHGC